MSQRYLRKKQGDATVYIFTDGLAARGDMIECDASGGFIADIKAPEPEQAPEAASKVDTTKAELVAIAQARYGLAVGDETPTVAIVDAIEAVIQSREDEKPAIEKMTKAELVAFAKQNFGVDLDETQKVAELRAEVAKLAAAGNPGA